MSDRRREQWLCSRKDDQKFKYTWREEKKQKEGKLFTECYVLRIRLFNFSNTQEETNGYVFAEVVDIRILKLVVCAFEFYKCVSLTYFEGKLKFSQNSLGIPGYESYFSSCRTEFY